VPERHRFVVIAAAAAMLFAVTVKDTLSQGLLEARQRAAVGPGVRNAHAMVFDPRRERVLMFGGADATSVRGDLWSWDGARWTLDPRSGPSPRTFPAMAWDAARGEAVLFGGRRVLFGTEKDRDTFLTDTWLLRTSGWHRAAASGPPPRAEAGIAHDPSRGVVVLFGGYNDAGGKTNRLGDTWEWDGSRWEQKADSGPSPRNGVAMAYDDGARRVVLFGGSGGPRSDTWAWNGRRWQAIVTNQVPGAFNSLIRYDAGHRQLVRTTGWNGRERVADTWILDGTEWRLATSEGPVARNHSALAFDAARRALVLFGGHDGERVFGDVWEWDGTRWQERLAITPEVRLNNGH
jgi:hypothetical protein